MFRAEINNGDLLEWVSTLDCLVDEAKVRVEEDRIWSTAVEAGNVGMVETTLREDAFESFEADPETMTPEILGVDVSKLKEVLKIGGKRDTARVELDEDSHKLNVSVGTTTYTLSLIDHTTIRDEPDISDGFGLPVEAVMEWRHIHTGVQAADMVTDHVELSADREGVVRIVGEGLDDSTETEIVTGLSEFSMNGEAESDRVSSLVAIGYLQNIRSGVPNSDTEVEVRVGDSQPITIDFTNADETMDTRYALAPRLD